MKVIVVLISIILLAGCKSKSVSDKEPVEIRDSADAGDIKQFYYDANTELSKMEEELYLMEDSLAKGIGTAGVRQRIKTLHDSIMALTRRAYGDPKNK